VPLQGSRGRRGEVVKRGISLARRQRKVDNPIESFASPAHKEELMESNRTECSASSLRRRRSI